MRFFAIEELFGQRHIPSTDFLCRRRMTAGEVERAIVVLQKERLKMRQRVLFAEQAPDTVLEVGMAIVKLDSLHFVKLLNQGFIDDEVLVAVLSWRLVLMLADALLQELRHSEVRIAQQGRNARDRSHHLSIERPTAVAYQEVWFLSLYQPADESNRLLRVHRQIRGYHFCTALESLAQSHRRYALATGIESMKKQYLFHTQ